MNKVLERQIKNFFGNIESIPQNLYSFLKIVSDTYDHNEEDRLLTERSLEISSKELGDLNKAAKDESEQLKNSLIEMERMNKLMINRELKMIELKKKIELLKNGK